jgi:hypothetical protein
VSDFTYEATISRVERRGTSVNGNPTYKIFFEDHHPALTMSDTMWAYEASNPEWQGARVTVTASRAGRIRWCQHAESPEMVAKYNEYAVIVADGPSEGMILRTSRNMDQARRCWDANRAQVDARLVIRRRTVMVSAWEDLATTDDRGL